MNRIASLLYALTFAIAVSSCGGGGGNGETSNDDAGNGDAGGTAPTASLSVRAHARNTLMAVAEIVLSEPGTIAIELASAATGTRRIDYPGSAGTHVVTVVGMRPSTAYSLVAVAELASGGSATSEAVGFTTGALPDGAPSVVLDTSSAQSVGGVTLFGYGVGQRSDAAAPLYWGVDEEGVIVWYLHDTSVTRADPLIRALDDGNLLVVLENEARIVTPAGETVASRDLSAVTGFHHDVVLLSDGHLVALGQERVTIDGVTLWNDTIHELDAAGNEVWRWSAAEHLDTGRFPGALSTTETRGGLDWSHANALFAVDGEDALLFSSRSQGWVVKIDRSSGDVLWILGDGAGTSPGFDAPFFGLNAGSWFTAQHAPMIDSDGHLLLYDNRNESGGASANSRVVAYALDETAMAASQQWEYVVPKYTASLGDVDEIAAGHRLVCAGGPAPGDDHARVIEIGGGDTPTALWGIIVDAPVYRAERVAWAGFR